MSEPRMEYQARFWRPGAFFGEDWYQPIESADPKTVEWPDMAYCFDLFERKAFVGPDGTEYHTDWKKIGKRYYHPDSKVLTLGDVKARPEFCRPTSFLATNMEHNGWKSVVLSRWGDWPQEFDPVTDEILTK